MQEHGPHVGPGATSPRSYPDDGWVALVSGSQHGPVVEPDALRYADVEPRADLVADGEAQAVVRQNDFDAALGAGLDDLVHDLEGVQPLQAPCQFGIIRHMLLLLKYQCDLMPLGAGLDDLVHDLERIQPLQAEEHLVNLT